MKVPITRDKCLCAVNTLHNPVASRRENSKYRNFIQKLIKDEEPKLVFLSFLLRNWAKVLWRWFKATREGTVFFHFYKLSPFHPFLFLLFFPTLLRAYWVPDPENAETNKVAPLPRSLRLLPTCLTATSSNTFYDIVIIFLESLFFCCMVRYLWMRWRAVCDLFRDNLGGAEVGSYKQNMIDHRW